ncbi:MAG: ATP-binding protein [bacterium]
MRHSLRLRLLLILVVVPVAALASVAVAARYANDSNLDSRLQFQIAPLKRAGGGPTNPDRPETDLPVFTTEINIDPNSQPVTFEPGDGQAYTIQAERGFVEAYEQDRKNTIAAINQQTTVAAVGVAVISLVAAVWLSRRIVRPVEELTDAARLLESGDLTRRVAVSSGDEIGTLGNAFNAMAESIERNENLRKQMTSDVAHELRTPLNNIAGYLDAISDGVVEPTPNVVESLQEEAELLVRLVADLEQLSLADAGHQHLMQERLSLSEVIDRAVALVTPRARNREIAIETQLEPEAFAIGDARRLGQVARNLIENAVTHTPSGGSVLVALKKDNEDLVLEVADTGAGIEPEHLPFIFERFYRADASRNRATGGAGLGLAIVRQLVEAHGGRVTAEANSPHGALFRVTIPAASGVGDRENSASAVPARYSA